MIPLEPPTGPVSGGEAAVAVALAIAGIASMTYFGRMIWFSHPPRWVATYRGGSHWILGQPFLGLFMFMLAFPTLRNVLPTWSHRPIGLICVAALLIGLCSMFVWFPTFLLPGWYRRARAAGVDVHSPESVEAFRQLPRAEQDRAIAQRRGQRETV